MTVIGHDGADDRALRARIASTERWGRIKDRSAATDPARRGLRAKFEGEADPDSVLPPAERARRADHLMRAHMLRMSRASARSPQRHRSSERCVAIMRATAMV